MEDLARKELANQSSGKGKSVWTEGESQVPATMPDGRPWPKISIVTPSYNQGRFIEETIRSVLCQGYPNLEYIIVDGGSTDETVEIIRRYESQLKYWVSEKDKGQTDAIDKGFQRCTGEIMAYINSDDLYLPYTFELVATLFTQFPEVNWLTGHASFLVDQQVIMPRRRHLDAFNSRLFQLGFHTPWLLGIPQQVSTFWGRSLYQKAGGKMNTSLNIAMDVDLWVRMARFSSPVFVEATLAMMRLHSTQKSSVPGVAFPEIESGQYGFWPLAVRRLVWFCMKVPGLRGLLRRVLLRGEAQRLGWNCFQETWELKQCYAF